MSFNVLHVSDNLNLGGLQRVMVDLCNESTRTHGVNVGIFARIEGELVEAVDKEVELINCPEFKDKGWLSQVRYIRALRAVLSGSNWQVVHAHQRQAAILARVATVGLNVVVVEHVHNTFPSRGWKGLISFRSAHLIACGSHIRQMLIESFHCEPEKVHLVTNSILSRSATNHCSDDCKVTGVLSIIGVGRLAHEKDPLRFIDIVRCVALMGQPCHATWVGDGALRDDFDEKCKLLPELLVVQCTGFLDSALSHLASSDLLLLPSRREGLPLVLVESASVGTAIVCSDVGSCRDVVVDGSTGLVFKLEDSNEAVAERIVYAYQQGHFRIMGDQARQKFQDDHSFDRFIAEIFSVYEAALTGGRKLGVSNP